MKTNKFQPFFDGYLQAVMASICTLAVLFLISTGIIEWSFLGFIFVVFIAMILHFLFLLVLYMAVLPLISAIDIKGSQFSFRALMDRYVPLFAIPFAAIFGLLWMGDSLNNFFTFVILDMLFTCYIALYYYIKNKRLKYESA